jgi:arsenate reductase (glutaredoxin)
LSPPWGSLCGSFCARRGTPYAELGLDDPTLSDEQLLDAMLAHPILINRPIVVTDLGTKLCRPSEEVIELLPVPKLAPFVKEDGEVVQDAGRRRGSSTAS